MTLLLIALGALIVWGLWTLLRRHRDDGEAASDPDSSLPFSPATTSSSSTAAGGAATAFTVMGSDDATSSPAGECRSDDGADAGGDSSASCDSGSDASSSSGD